MLIRCSKSDAQMIVNRLKMDAKLEPKSFEIMKKKRGALAEGRRVGRAPLLYTQTSILRLLKVS